MLVLSRKAGQKVQIGEEITVTINRISGNRVTIGIDAPPEVRILRGELQVIVGTEGTEALPVEYKEAA